MKTFLCIILAVIILPLVFSFFQAETYEHKLKSKVTADVSQIFDNHELSKLPFKVDHLDVVVTGGVDLFDVGKLSHIEDDLESLGYGEIRAGKYGLDRKTFGTIDVSKKGNSLEVDGILNDYSGIFNNLSGTGFAIQKTNEILVNSFFVDSIIATSPALKDWSREFFKTQVQGGFTLSAKDDIIKPYGRVSVEEKDRLEKLAKGSGLTIDPVGLQVGKRQTAELRFTNSGGEDRLTGFAPNKFNASKLFPEININLSKNDAYSVSRIVNSPRFGDWVKGYLSEKGDRELKVKGNSVIMSGVATPSLLSNWNSQLEALSLKPKSELTLYPSVYHYPGYKMESELTPEAAKPLIDAFALNQIFFDTGKSDIRNDQKEKVIALTSSIKAAGEKVKFIIGGHADSSGDIEVNRKLSKQRAQSVVEALSASGISDKQFTIAYFGAAKSSGSGDNESDRKVEILIK